RPSGQRRRPRRRHPDRRHRGLRTCNCPNPCTRRGRSRHPGPRHNRTPSGTTRSRLHMSEFESANFFTDRSVQDDPYPYFDWVREQGPVWRDPKYGLFMITGHPEAMTIYGDPATFPPGEPAAGTYSSCNVVSGPFVKFSSALKGDDVSAIIERCRNELPFSDQLPSFDPPNHTDHRHLLMRLITPKRLKENEDFMWRYANHL